MRILGIILIIAGTLALAYKGFTYEKEDPIDIGGIAQVNLKHKEHIPIPPWAAGGALAVGVVLVLVGGRRR